MKTMFSLLLLLVLNFSAFAQEQTLFEGSIEHGGFGGPAIQFTSINDKLGVLVGGGGGWIVNHTIVIGGFGYGLANEIIGRQVAPDSSFLINLGYGGLYLAWIYGSDDLLHFTVNTLVGGGGVDYRRRSWSDNHNNNDEFNDNDPNFRTDVFFVVEPGINLEMNVAANFRIALGVNYRFISDVDLEGMSNSTLSGPAVGLVFKFGSF
jgi:hypothetical protein